MLLKHLARRSCLCKQAVQVSDPESPIFRPWTTMMRHLPIHADDYKKTLGLRDKEISGGFEPIQKVLPELLKQYRNLDTGRELAVNLGSQRMFSDVGRVWKNKDMTFLQKLLYTGFKPLASSLTALDAGDYYDPSAHSITLYHPALPVLAHELGHANHVVRKKQWDRMQRKLDAVGDVIFSDDTAKKKKAWKSWYDTQLGEEERASANALRALSKIDEKQLPRHYKVLNKARGTYVNHMKESFPDFVGDDQAMWKPKAPDLVFGGLTPKGKANA